MKKGVVIVAVIILVLATILVFNKLTGQIISEKGNCIDSDNGLNYFVKGSVKYANRDRLYTDYCFDKDKRVKEYYCVVGLDSKIYKCPSGCVDGACINQTA